MFFVALNIQFANQKALNKIICENTQGTPKLGVLLVGIVHSLHQ